ncbi:aldo/keto reductase [Cellulomonas sp. P5_E12]
MSSPDPAVRRVVGPGVEVGVLTVGASALGSDRVDDETAAATITAALTGPLAVLDTSNGYGRSEERIGSVLRSLGGVPAGHLVATKVDPADGVDDFSGDRVRRSVEESLERLGLDRLPLVHLHDPERITFAAATAPGGPLEALLALRDEGVVGLVGVAGGPAAMMERFVRLGVFDALVTHNRLTLLDRSADALLDAAVEHGVAVFNAAPFGGGILAREPRPSVPLTYAYRPATPDHLAALTAIAAACTRHGVPVPAAALQLSTRDPRVASTIVGATRPQQIDDALAWARHPVPADLWDELAKLVPDQRVWLGPDGR